MTDQPQQHRTAVLLFTDIVDSVELQGRLGTHQYAEVLRRHDQLFRQLVEKSSGRILKHTGDGFLADFNAASEAVNVALAFQILIHREDWAEDGVSVRVGLHQGEVIAVPDEDPDASPLAVGMAVNIAARVMDLGDGGQILMTKPVFDSARHFVRKHPPVPGGEADDLPELEWCQHGEYILKGAADSVSIFQVGADGVAPMDPPGQSKKAMRVPDTGRATRMTTPELPVEEIDSSDIFISFAHLDDLSMHHDEPGWITRLHRTLEIRLGQLTGKPVKVWRDPKTDRLDEYDPKVGERLPRAGALVPVLSPPFARSTGCQAEVMSYYEGKQQDNLNPRVFKVVKTPVDESQFEPRLRAVFGQLNGFNFFEEDDRGQLVEFDESFGEDSRRRFLHRVYDLAHEISNSFLPGPEGIGATVATGRDALRVKTVYLAETTPELQDKRDQVRREMIERGFKVVPEQPLPTNPEDLRLQAQRAMVESDLVLHLVGSTYGVPLVGSEVSAVEEQCRTEIPPGGPNVPRIIWAPPASEISEKRQAEFVTKIEQGDLGYQNVEFIRGSIEQLKRLAVKSLEIQAVAPPLIPEETDVAKMPEPVAEKLIYIVCESADETEIEPLEDYLFEQGFEVKVPAFDGDPSAFATVHQQQLAMCDAVLIYYGSASAQWAEMKLMDLRKAPGLGRKEPFVAQGIYIAPPHSRRKERFRTRAAIVMHETGEEFNPSSLDPFIEKVREAE